MSLSSKITGSIFTIGGIGLLITSFFAKEIFYVPLLYGLAFFIIGLFILFNKKEDSIEQIKSVKKSEKNSKRRAK